MIKRERIRHGHVELDFAYIPAIGHALKSVEKEGASSGHSGSMPDMQNTRYSRKANPAVSRKR